MASDPVVSLFNADHIPCTDGSHILFIISACMSPVVPVSCMKDSEPNLVCIRLSMPATWLTYLVLDLFTITIASVAYKTLKLIVT
jgi:hypothetical protein